MNALKMLVSVFLLVFLVIVTATNAQAYGLLPDPTPIPETTTEPEPTPTPLPEPEPSPSAAPVVTQTLTPEPTPTVETLEPIPTSIIMKAISPRAFIIGTETAEEKQTIIADNIDSITASLNFLKKRGFDISGMQAVLAQITDGIDGFTEKQIDSIANITATIDEEIVMTIFTGSITQQDIDRMSAQITDAMRQLENVTDVETTEIDTSMLLMALGFMAGVLLAQLTVKGFDG